MPRVLVTGRRGQLGTELLRRGHGEDLTLAGFDRGALDITRPDDVDAAVDASDAVINAAAYTAVDRAEDEPQLAHAVNEDGPRNLARACARRGIPLIHVSTDYVFDGAKAEPWREDDPVAPLGVYGASKAAGERAVRQACPHHVIVRTSWIYAAHGQNFVRTMLRLGAERDELRVVDDQIGAPTAAADLADALLAIVRALLGGRQEAFGTFHYAAAGATSWFGLADAVFERAAARRGRRPRLTPIATKDYPTPARRPANSILDCTKIAAAYNPPRRPWQAGLDEVMAELLNREQGTPRT